MKNHLVLYLLMLLPLGIQAQEAQKNTYTNAEILSIISSLNFNSFQNRNVGDLLDSIGVKEKQILFIPMRPFVLTFVRITYADSLSLDIYIKNYKYLPKVTENESDWKIDLLRKEKIGKLRLVNGRSIIKEHPSKPDLPRI